MKLSVIISFLVISTLENTYAQNSYFKLGQQALMDGDFKAAVAQLEKACLLIQQCKCFMDVGLLLLP